jgi:hypothetical protein
LPAESSAPRPRVTARYGIFRSLVRLGIRLLYRKTRRLNAESFPSAGAVLVVVSHPPGFLETLLLVAALDRQTHCRLERRLVQGMGRRFLAWGLGMIVVAEPSSHGVEAAGTRLTNGEAVAVFAEPQGSDSGASPGFSVAAHLAAAGLLSPSGEELPLVLVHLFLPAGRAAGDELLISFDRPLDARSLLAPADPAKTERALAAALEEACRRSVFSLPPEDLGHFLADLEEVSKNDLAEDWSARRNWKQQLEGLRISGFVAEWVDQLNFLQPGRLVAMRERLSAYREAQRRAALRRLKVETAGAWINSAWRRAVAWAESILTLPLALYGLVNHLLAAALFYAAGLSKKSSQLERRTRWTVGALVILVCYAGQILLCAHLEGRAAAGYYALTLPVSGLDLWRYAWLMRRRTGLLVLRALKPHDVRSLRRQRKRLLSEMDAARQAQVETLGLAH